MNGGFDFGILILGLGALAFLAGLGNWIWLCVKKTNAAETAQNTLEYYASDPSTKALQDTLAPEIQAAPSESLQPAQLPTPPQIPKTQKRTPPFPSLFSKLLKS